MVTGRLLIGWRLPLHSAITAIIWAPLFPAGVEVGFDPAVGPATGADAGAAAFMIFTLSVAGRPRSAVAALGAALCPGRKRGCVGNRLPPGGP